MHQGTWGHRCVCVCVPPPGECGYHEQLAAPCGVVEKKTLFPMLFSFSIPLFYSMPPQPDISLSRGGVSSEGAGVRMTHARRTAGATFATEDARRPWGEAGAASGAVVVRGQQASESESKTALCGWCGVEGGCDELLLFVGSDGACIHAALNSARASSQRVLSPPLPTHMGTVVLRTLRD